MMQIQISDISSNDLLYIPACFHYSQVLLHNMISQTTALYNHGVRNSSS
jgi:hypothetical protein